MATRSDTWMPLYVGDYLRDTGHLTAAEHGGYLLLLMQAWTSGGALPADEKRLRAIARMERAEWKRARPVLMGFFHRAGDTFRHKRIDQELSNAQGIVDQRKTAGKAGADARWSKKDDGGAMATASKKDGGAMANASGKDGETDAVAIAPPMANAWQNDAPSPSPSQRKKDSASLRSAPAAAAPGEQIDLLEALKIELWGDGLGIFRRLTRYHEDRARKALGRLLSVAGGDHALLLEVLRKAETEQPDGPMDWITAGIQARLTPLLTIGSAGPSDPYGIRAWIARQPDVHLAEHATNGRMMSSINGFIVEDLAETIANAARLPESWRGNWDAMGAWMREDIFITEPVLYGIRHQAERMGGEVVRSIAVFDATVRNARRVA